MTGEPTTDTAFPTQSDAENWFGEVWRELADAGVAAVTLHRDGERSTGRCASTRRAPEPVSSGRSPRATSGRGMRVRRIWKARIAA